MPCCLLVSRATKADFMPSIRRVLTNAEMLALPTTPINLVAAPGVGKKLVAISTIITLKNWVANYTNIAANAELAIGNQHSFPTLMLQSQGSQVSNLLAAGESAFNIALASMPSDQINTTSQSGYLDADFDNLPLQLRMTNGANGNLTGGNAAQSIVVEVYYMLSQ